MKLSHCAVNDLKTLSMTCWGPCDIVPLGKPLFCDQMMSGVHNFVNASKSADLKASYIFLIVRLFCELGI